MEKIRFPNESPGYRGARDRLLEAEKSLRRHVEEVSALRRQLPPGGEVPEDYVFGGERGDVSLSQLFERGDTLIAYSFMYGPKMAKACPSCTSIVDALDGTAPHVVQRANFVVIARSPLPRFLEHARTRGWRHAKLLSSAGNSYNRDYHAETADGSQVPMLNVFRKERGKVKHFYGTELVDAPAEKGQDPRHVDMIWPLWNLLDLTPEGRGSDWNPKLQY
jgi:predicted dithiol-disulfide oxidoreductase (DUF899 family)